MSLVGMHFVGKKKWWAWMIHVANTFILTYINYRLRLWGFVPVNMIMLGIFCRNAQNWYAKENA